VEHRWRGVEAPSKVDVGGAHPERRFDGTVAEDSGAAMFLCQRASAMDGGGLEGVLRYRGNERGEGKVSNQRKAEHGVELTVKGRKRQWRLRYRRPVQTRCKGGSVEVVRDQVAGETVRGGKGGDGGRSVHFIADAVMVEMARGGGGVRSEHG
jgi:hypothetical protein